MAAYGVVANFGTIILNTLNGVSQTMQPLISINDGAGKNHRVRAFLRTGVLTAIGVMGVYVLIGELWPDLLIRIFVDSTDPSFLAMSRLGIRIVFPCYLATGVTVALNVYFEAVQATSEAFWLSLLRGIFAPVLSVFVCAFFWGTQGVWISFLVSECRACSWRCSSRGACARASPRGTSTSSTSTTATAWTIPSRTYSGASAPTS